MKGYVQLRRGILEHLSSWTGTEATVYIALLCLAQHSGSTAGTVACSRAELSEIAGSSPRNVSRAVKSLEDAGYITVQRSTNRWHETVYKLTKYQPSTRDKNDPSNVPSKNVYPSQNVPSSVPSRPPVSRAEVAPKNEKNVSDGVPSSESKQIMAVFEHWKAATGRDRAILSEDRSTRIRARLREGYTVAQLCEAAENAAADPFHAGDNDRGKKFDDIPTIFRSASKVDSFLDERAPQTGTSALAAWVSGPPRPKMIDTTTEGAMNV